MVDIVADAIWIENMNTVLDDNCTLCLPNGERIKLNPGTMRMLFEVHDLAVASPATVSRCGMVYVPIEELGWRPFIETWLVTSLDDVPQTVKDLIWGLFDSLVDPVLQWIRSNGYEYFKSVDINLVTSLARILESMLKAHSDVILKVWCSVLSSSFTFPIETKIPAFYSFGNRCAICEFAPYAIPAQGFSACSQTKGLNSRSWL